MPNFKPGDVVFLHSCTSPHLAITTGVVHDGDDEKGYRIYFELHDLGTATWKSSECSKVSDVLGVRVAVDVYCALMAAGVTYRRSEPPPCTILNYTDYRDVQAHVNDRGWSAPGNYPHRRAW